MRKAAGATPKELEVEFGHSKFIINKALSSDLAKAVIKGVIDDAVTGAIIAVKRKLADMTELAMETLEHHLKEEKSLEAVKIYLKGLGMDTQEKTDTKQSQSITVILPHAATTKDIEVTHEDSQ